MTNETSSRVVGETEGEAEIKIFITILVCYGIVTGTVLAVMACAGLPFFFYHCSSLREEDEARETNATVNANINASGDANFRHLNQAGFVVCATLCWPALMLVALGAALIEIKAACKRFMLARRQRWCISDEGSPDRRPTTPNDLEGGDTIRSSGSYPAVVTTVAVVLVDELPGAITPALTTK